VDLNSVIRSIPWKIPCSENPSKVFSAIWIPSRDQHVQAFTYTYALGGLAGILSVTYLSQQYLDQHASTLVVASMGASAVLLFAVPHGPLSQPWSVLAGHTVSAVIGIACAQWISNILLASALAVALTIGCMH
jgi:CBS-domain-containing membrane protein